MQSPRVCWGPVRQEARSAKIQRPPFRRGCLQEAHKWPLVGFLRIGTLWRHPTKLGARKRPLWRAFLANFHAVPLAAIGHMHHVDAGHHLEQLAGYMGWGSVA